ncbi:MAG: hypothetical protein IH594_09345 [Bacteroidales bacterium]|nr:hypothetical protein [Bacteroidales bacterium]
MIRRNFNNALGILEVFYEGNVGLPELLDFGREIRESKEYPRCLKIIIDATQASYELNYDEIVLLGNSLQTDIESYDSVKSAMIHSMPKETALSMIFENRQRIPNYFRRIFASRMAAMEWLSE